jgi:cyclopropane fatty-acyl-phospholipid synthase-like methyltransferase
MSNSNQKWQEFWGNRADALHQSNNDAFISRYAAELLLLIGERPVSSVMEMGCGNGDLFVPLGFDKTVYAGTDFSSAMIEEFRRRFPSANVSVASIQDTVISQPVDLVFSSGVMQYLSPAEFLEHLRKVKPMLNAGGRIIHTSITWKLARDAMYRRELFELPSQLTLKNRLAALAIRLGLKADGMGHWYDMSQLRQMGRDAGLTCDVYGSLVYPYRCHAVFQAAAA